MSVLWTSDEIAEATGGVATEAFGVSGLSIDTRTLQRGDLFVALKDVRDGHDFIDFALKAGASGVISERPEDLRAVHVADTMRALEALGQAGRDRCAARRVAVTGSVGKTSVKDALAVMLSEFGSTHKSIRSFNNHIGVPITLATMPRDTEFAVFETGMNNAGELTHLSRQVAPHIALITTVAGAHQANFENVEAIADAKAEIRHGLVQDGTLILNADNDYTPRIMAQAESLSVVSFGSDQSCDIQVVDADYNAEGGRVTLRTRAGRLTVRLNVSGAHWGHNAAACIAVAQVLGLDMDRAAATLSSVTASEGRGDIFQLSLNGKSITLIDESYNANPTSMRAAIAAAGLREGRKLAILGDMYELGPDELKQHAGLAEPLETAGFSRVMTIGESMRALRGALSRHMRAAQADTVDDLKDSLFNELEEGDILLIKGSNATGLGKLAAQLKSEGAAHAV